MNPTIGNIEHEVQNKVMLNLNSTVTDITDCQNSVDAQRGQDFMTLIDQTGNGQCPNCDLSEGRGLQQVSVTDTDTPGCTVCAGDEPRKETIDKGPPWWRSQRYILAYFMFGAMMNIFFHRLNLSIAIICMVNHTAINAQHRDLLYTDSQPELDNSLLEPQVQIQLRKSNQSGINKSAANSFALRTNQSEKLNNPLQIASREKLFSVNTSLSYSTLPLLISGKGQNLSTRKLSSNLTQLNNASELDFRMKDFGGGAITGDAGNELRGDQIVSEPDGKCSAGYRTEEEKKEDGTLVWSKQTQGLLLGSLYWGYFIIQIPGNHLVRNWNRRTVIASAMFVMATAAMLCHVTAMWSPWALFVMRVIQGCCTAFTIVSVYGIWLKWAPPSEKAGLISLSWSGHMFAQVTGFPLSALLCEYGFLGGWQSIFYVFGLITFVWLGLFLFFTSETPDSHRFITQNEREYITSSLPTGNTSAKLPDIPWSSMLTSRPFWGIVCAHWSYNWCLVLQQSSLPQYLFEILKLDIESNGLVSMLPYTALLVVTQMAGRLSDCLVKRRILRVIWTRRMCIIIANLTPALALIALSFVECSQPVIAIVLLTVAIGGSGFGVSGFLVNPTDIAPRFASQIMTLSNTISSIPGILVPYVVAAITKDQTREQWQIVFFLSAAILVLGLLGFCLLARGDVQSWAMDRGNELMCETIEGEEETELQSRSRSRSSDAESSGFSLKPESESEPVNKVPL